MTEQTTRSAYDLLSKPTLELTDQDIENICKDLRTRRERFLAVQKDNPPKKATPPKTKEEKEALGDSILGDVVNLL